MPWSAIASLGGSVLGGILGKKGQAAANRANLQIAREQMAFQERMSSTANQRAAQDLEKAGLNRILALGRPASSPGGASAQMASETAIAADAARNAVSNAQTAKLVNRQLKNLETANDLMHADIALKSKQQGKLALETNGVAISNAQQQQILDGLQVEGAIDRSNVGKLSRILQRYNPFASTAAGLLKGMK